MGQQTGPGTVETKVDRRGRQATARTAQDLGLDLEGHCERVPREDRQLPQKPVLLFDSEGSPKNL